MGTDGASSCLLEPSIPKQVQRRCCETGSHKITPRKLMNVGIISRRSSWQDSSMTIDIVTQRTRRSEQHGKIYRSPAIFIKSPMISSVTRCPGNRRCTTEQSDLGLGRKRAARNIRGSGDQRRTPTACYASISRREQTSRSTPRLNSMQWLGS